MPNETYVWLGRIKAVEREHTTMRFAADRLSQVAQAEPGILAGDLRPRDIRTASARLDGTYIIRLFAEFETGLRMFLRAKRIRPPSRAEYLVNRVATKARIPNEQLRQAHAVRRYRNILVHEREEAAEAMSIRQATSYLCTFFDPLKSMW
jgi:hypothetical protein